MANLWENGKQPPSQVPPWLLCCGFSPRCTQASPGQSTQVPIMVACFTDSCSVLQLWCPSSGVLSKLPGHYKMSPGLDLCSKDPELSAHTVAIWHDGRHCSKMRLEVLISITQGDTDIASAPIVLTALSCSLDNGLPAQAAQKEPPMPWGAADRPRPDP